MTNEDRVYISEYLEKAMVRIIKDEVQKAVREIPYTVDRYLQSTCESELRRKATKAMDHVVIQVRLDNPYDRD